MLTPNFKLKVIFYTVCLELHGDNMDQTCVKVGRGIVGLQAFHINLTNLSTLPAWLSVSQIIRDHFSLG